MSSRDVDAFLAESQEVLDDYVTWHGSADSATWTADGSHEPDQIGGDYYGDDPRWAPAPGLVGMRTPWGCVTGAEINLNGFDHTPPDEPPEVTPPWDRIRETVASVLTTLRHVRGRYTAQLRHTTYATDTHGRPSRVRAVWDNPFSQEDQ